MKYKIGDKVKIKDKVECDYGISDEYINKFKNQILNIKSCDKSELGNWYKIVEDTGKFNWNENMLELVEEKNKFKIGQRVKIKRTGKIGKILEIDCEDYSKDYGYSKYSYRIEIDNSCWYFTVHDLEEVEEILNEKEKEYLKSIVKPLRDKVLYIEKCNGDEDIEYIKIAIRDGFNLIFPDFEKGTMYKGMKVNKKYILEELGL